ncbi:transcriptional regulator [Candidatus Poriferisodalis sp.]|uniref:transcriptional regulator n=1 Tax=Candidatus Poriferisodalis sp. TaxID=3101277 RepID=UPI003B5163E2
MSATRFTRLVEIPDDLADGTVAPERGRVMLPRRLAWSGQGEFDLDDRRDRMYVYQLVMTEGTSDDVRRYIDLRLLVEMWHEMWLSPHVRERWDRWLRDRELIA